MKKKLVSVLLVGAMAATMVAGCGSSDENTSSNNSADGTEVVEESEAVTYSNDQVIIGEGSETSGDITPWWVNGASDYDAYKLTTGMGTVEGTSDGQWIYNETVLDGQPEQVENEDGSQTWTFKIKEGLKFSDGTDITAANYVLGYMLWCSDEVITGCEAANAVTNSGMYLAGFGDYSEGTTDTFSGIHLIDDYTYSVTVDPEWLPYYYGAALVGANPESFAWLPEDVTLEETEDGVKFSDNYTTEYIKDTIDTYRYNPTQCSGPYKFVSYDESGYAYTLEKNENYPGNYEGQTANIQTVILKYVAQDTMLDQLKTGAVDILTEVADGDQIETGLDMVEEGGFDYISYPRAGYGMITFKCNKGPTQFVEVRQAVAYLLDRTAFAQTFTGGHGTVVNGPYGTQQWMVNEYAEEIEDLNSYTESLESAVEVLKAGGWVYNEDGSDYVDGSGEIRYKKLDDGTYMPLIIEWFSSENNSVSDLLVTSLQKNPDLAEAGMQINQTVGTFTELLTYYYDTSDDLESDPYCMFNLATGFSNPYDEKVEYEPGGESNTTCLDDEELYSYILEMNHCAEGDDEAYGEAWLKFIQRWNELLPQVPLYSNEYHDFFTSRLHDFVEDGYNNDVTSAILYANIE